MKIPTLFLALAGLSFSSCSNFDNQAQNDAATGALLGGAAGALLSDGDNRATGAALGAALGGGAGYAVGSNR